MVKRLMNQCGFVPSLVAIRVEDRSLEQSTPDRMNVRAEKFVIKNAPPPPARPSKVINDFQFSLLDQILRNQTMSGGAVTVCSFLMAVLLFAFVPDRSSSTVTTLCGALAIVMGIFGLGMLTGAMRIAKIIESAPEIVLGVEARDTEPKRENDHSKSE